MTAEQIERPDMLSSHWRHMQKAFSELLVPAAQNSTGRPSPLHIKQRLASNPSFSESITTYATKDIIKITTASAAKPWFPDSMNLTCKKLLFYVLKFFLH
jgi:hypothetical protein